VNSLRPRLEVLPPAQRALWPRLSEVASDFILYGGTALSLQVGGRTSIDFDLFSDRPLDHEHLVKRFSFLQDGKLRKQARDTAIFVVGTGSEAVSISFFGDLKFGRVSEPVRFIDNGLFAAGLLDLAAQKMKVIQQRAEVKDYLDIRRLLSEGITLEMALGAAQALYPEFNAAISLKALSYFGDVSRLAPEIQRDLRMTASRVRAIAPIARQSPNLRPNV